MSDDVDESWHALTIGGSLVATGPVPGGTRFRRHEHEGVHLCIVLDGGFVESRPDGPEDVGPGTVRVSPSARHDIDFSPRGARCAVLELGPAETDRSVARGTRFLRDPWLAGLVARLDRALSGRALDAPARVEEAAIELLAQVERRQVGRSAPPPPWLRAARELLHDDPSAGSLGALASRLEVHRVHLARAFRDHYGETVGDHLRRIRLMRATRMLRDCERPLSQVALDAGFTDQSHMTRALRASLGLTPSQARRALLSFKTAALR
jgi:AraC family transcriptional regulator